MGFEPAIPVFWGYRTHAQWDAQRKLPNTPRALTALALSPLNRETTDTCTLTCILFQRAMWSRIRCVLVFVVVACVLAEARHLGGMTKWQHGYTNRWIVLVTYKYIILAGITIQMNDYVFRFYFSLPYCKTV